MKTKGNWKMHYVSEDKWEKLVSEGIMYKLITIFDTDGSHYPVHCTAVLHAWGFKILADTYTTDSEV
jgi:hypothetical protein